MPHLSVVIPVYRAEACLPELARRLEASLETVTKDFEVILVEDCGGDRSWELIRELSLRDTRFKGLQFSRNFGQHYGITAGIDHADGDWLVVMDCDLQDRPEEIPRLYARAREGFDVVLANRGTRSHSPVKRFASWAFYGLFNYLTDVHHDGRVGNFRIISRKVAENFRTMREQLRFFGGLVDWLGFPTATIDVQHDSRFAGESTYTVRKLVRLATETIIAYSDKPLRLTIKFGFLLSFLSFLYGCRIIYRTLTTEIPVLGWSSLIVSLYFLGGIMIASIGMLGVYLGRTFDETKKRPLYVVSRTAGIIRPERRG
jgi:glycosyltransferase involved in cell wall biosynthesis